MLPLALAVVGLIGLIVGFFVSSSLRSRRKQDLFVARWATVATVLGGLLAVANFVSVGFSYPLDGARVMGIPFLCAYFDHRGFDYVGPLSLPAAIANALFWFFVPKIVLFVAFIRRGPTPPSGDEPPA